MKYCVEEKRAKDTRADIRSIRVLQREKKRSAPTGVLCSKLNLHRTYQSGHKIIIAYVFY